jgi:hypothetical protein
MDTINIYDLTINFNYDFNYIYEQLINFARSTNFKQTYLLNTQIDDENQNPIEKFVYDNAEFHISEYNKTHNTNINIHDIYIEFWSLNDTTFKRMHFDKDEQDYLVNHNITTYSAPFLSCITYLNDDNYAPTLITDIIRKYGSDDEREDICNTKHNNFGIIFPRKMRQVTFDGGNYLHGMYLLDKKCNNRLVLPMNFWFKKPKLLSYFPYYLYLKSNFSKESCVSIINNNSSIDYKRNIFIYNKITGNVTKIIHINIFENEIDKFNNWYEELITGNTTVDTRFFDKNVHNKSYIYYFKFIFILDKNKNKDK